MAGESLRRPLVVRTLNLLLILGPETDGPAWRVSCCFSVPAEKCLGGVSSCLPADSFHILLTNSLLFPPDINFCSHPNVPHASSISSSLISSLEFCSVGNTNYIARHYVVFASLLLLSTTQTKLSSSALYSRRPSACVLTHYEWTKFHTHI